MSNTFLTEGAMRQMAPSIFAEAPANDVSDKYSFISTPKILNILERTGWQPTRVMESKARKDENRGTQKHMIWLRNPEITPKNAGDESKANMPEIILTNSHNRTKAFNLMLGIYRLVCSNGLIAFRPNYGSVRRIHKDVNMADIVKEVTFLNDKMMDTQKEIVEYAGIEMSPELRRMFANDAAKLKWRNGLDGFNPTSLLKTRRDADKGSDIWTIMNTVQENLIKGGQIYMKDSGRQSSTRPTNNMYDVEKINVKLWDMMGEYADKIVLPEMM